MRMPINRMFKYIFITCKNYAHFALRRNKPSLFSFVSHSSQLPHCRHVLQFSPPRNFHATREEILYAGKPVRSKITLAGLRWLLGRSRLIGSCYRAYMGDSFSELYPLLCNVINNMCTYLFYGFYSGLTPFPESKSIC